MKELSSDELAEYGLTPEVMQLMFKRTTKARRIAIDRAIRTNTTPNVQSRHTVNSRGKKPAFHQRSFMGWDTEGHQQTPQLTMLVGGVNNQTTVKLTGYNISSQEMIPWLCDQLEEFNEYIHVGYSLNYDATMIVRTLPREDVAMIMRAGVDGHVVEINGNRYLVAWVQSKWIEIKRANGKRSKGGGKIFDVFSFFATSFLKACKDDGLDTWGIEDGKKGRNEFTYDDLDTVVRYWEQENLLLVQLMERFRDKLASANIYPNGWYGPGAIATYLLKEWGITNNIDYYDPDSDMGVAFRIAYAGGRFERFCIGSVNGPVYNADINSAYPAAMRFLPDLQQYEWKHTNGETPHPFAVYHYYWCDNTKQRIQPFFYREPLTNAIKYSSEQEGWAWSPEIANLWGDPRLIIFEAYEYGPVDAEYTYPLRDHVNHFYTQRQKLKAAGDPAQLGYKLGLNSLYGKLAQRAGYNGSVDSIPKYHCLPWAGYITSYCRAMIYDECQRIGEDNILAVETDGIYCAVPTGLTNSKALGEWETSYYDNGVYIQSGVRALLKDTEWSTACRGIPRGKFNYTDLTTVLSESMTGRYGGKIGNITFTISARRFVTGRAATTHANNTYNAGHWVDYKKTIYVIDSHIAGKRWHKEEQCPTCIAGNTTLHNLHYTVANSVMYHKHLSHPHLIPWSTQLTARQKKSDRSMQDAATKASLSVDPSLWA